MIAEDFRGRSEDVSMIHQRIKVQFKRQTNAKGGNRDVIKRYDTHKGDIRKIRHSGPGWSGVWNLRVV